MHRMGRSDKAKIFPVNKYMLRKIKNNVSCIGCTYTKKAHKVDVEYSRVCKLLLSKQTHHHPPNFKRLTIFFSTFYQPSEIGWFQSLLIPLKRLWDRLHSTHRKCTGIYILYKDVKSCPCEDVHVLWSILVESGSVPASSPPK
ncbi:hypothetical protein K1719_037762 [Acacia pycnantha]|nr:hypothetical protein K1719_037762 [Acacia pycnantha]